MSLKKIALAGGVAASLMAGTAYASVIDRPFFQVLGVVVVWGADEAGTANMVSDFVLLTPASGSAGADLITGDVRAVVTGSLDPIASIGLDGAGNVIDPATLTAQGVLDATSTLSAFGVGDDVTAMLSNVGPAAHTSSFYVASNAAFDIYAQSGALQGSGELFNTASLGDIKHAMSLDVTQLVGDTDLAFGSAAQDPRGTAATTLGAGFTTSDLGALAAQTKVFDGGVRTAASTGSLAEQSVRFNSVYSLGDGTTPYDLSQGAGTVYADVTYTIFVP